MKRNNILAVESLQKSHCTSVTTLASSTTIRKNPFDDMELFNPFSGSHTKASRNHNPSIIDDDHFATSDRTQLSHPENVIDNINKYLSGNKWLALHNAYGRKIIADRHKWSEAETAKFVL